MSEKSHWARLKLPSPPFAKDDPALWCGLNMVSSASLGLVLTLQTFGVTPPLVFCYLILAACFCFTAAFWQSAMATWAEQTEQNCQEHIDGMRKEREALEAARGLIGNPRDRRAHGRG